MKAYYYRNGSWIPYKTSQNYTVTKNNTEVTFGYISENTGKLTTAKGSLTEFKNLGLSKELPGALYYKRVGSTGPSLFAIDYANGVDIGSLIDSVATKDNAKTGLWLAIAASIGYLFMNG